MSLPRIKLEPEDFVVDEVPRYAPCGEGGHLFVHVEKRGRTTEQVASELARAAGVRPRDVGYAGRKDRHGVTRQWYSVPGLAPEAGLALALRDARVLAAVPHRHKLRTGHLRANRFALRVRDVSEARMERALEAAPGLRAHGLANAFGRQRFGRDGDNAARGLAILRGEVRPRDRRQGRFLVSALQAAVFDAVLAERPLPPHRFEVGDVARVEGSGGLFVVDDAAAADARAVDFEISPTGPIFGTRTLAPGAGPARREAAVLARLEVPPPAEWALPLPGARRPLRVRVGGLELEPDGTELRLRFELPPGSYATRVVESLLGPVAGA